MHKCIIFKVKARIPKRYKSHCVNKLLGLYEEWSFLQKYATRIRNIFHKRENTFIDGLNNFFDIASANATELIKFKENRQFLV